MTNFESKKSLPKLTNQSPFGSSDKILSVKSITSKFRHRELSMKSRVSDVSSRSRKSVQLSHQRLEKSNIFFMRQSQRTNKFRPSRLFKYKRNTTQDLSGQNLLSEDTISVKSSIKVKQKSSESPIITSKDSLYMSSFLKREQLRSMEVKLAVDSMRKNLPNYTLDEIRFFRLPLHEAILINLRERGFRSTAAFVSELCDLQDEMINMSPADSHVHMLPLLKTNQLQMKFLTDGLSIAETLHGQERFEEECEEFLKVAIHFAFGNDDWRWIGDEMLIRAIEISSRYQSINGKYEAISRYTYGRFLVKVLKDYIPAKQQLERAKTLCTDRKWQLTNLFPVKGPLCIQINELLYECYYQEVKRKMDQLQCGLAIDYATKAQTSAAAACLRISESNALYLKGKCLIKINEPLEAIKTLLKAIRIQNRFGTVEGRCKIRIQLVVAAMMQARTDMALNIMLEIKKEAEENNLPFYLAEGYRHIGFYLLQIGKPQVAYPILKEAFNLFKKAEVKTDQMEHVRNLQALAFGLEIFPSYAQIVCMAGFRDGSDNMVKLLNWKNDRTEFWDTPMHLSCTEISADFFVNTLTHAITSLEMCPAEYLSAKCVLTKEASIYHNRSK